MTDPKYHVGQRVTVRHPTGEWTGSIIYRNNTGLDDGGMSGWEYEVSNSPEHHPTNPVGAQWYPLVWEEEIVHEDP